jgi:DNA repair protein RadD
MCGRGLRIAEGKENCLILDFGQNISRHGPIDNITVEKRDFGEGDAPIKTCPECGFSDVPASARYCPECDFEFEFVETVLDANASKDKILSEAVWYDVDRVRYEHHFNKFKGSETMRVDYVCGLRKFSEWVCFQHTGYARLKAEQWWIKCCENEREPPKNVIDAVEAAQSGGLLEPLEILVHEQGKFPTILESKFI